LAHPAEDSKNPPSADVDIVGTIVEHERRLQASRCQQGDDAIADDMEVLAVAMDDVLPSDGTRIAVIARVPGRLKRAMGAVGRFLRWHVGGVVLALAVVLAAAEWAVNEREGRR
jgi:hypothetical protein